MSTQGSQQSERGQALILLVLGFVVLLGFTALAVDGGMVYSDRRHAQNAADASSLAGGGQASLYLENKYITYKNWKCSGAITNELGQTVYMSGAVNAAEVAAKSRATSNNFTIVEDDTVNGVSISCGDVVIPGAPWKDRYLDIFTVITANTQTSFIHFVYNGPVQNTVNAITRIRPRIPLAYGEAIVALNPAACSGRSNGVNFNGSNEIDVDGGGIFSNGCLNSDGTGLTVNVTNGAITYVEEYINNHDTLYADGGINQYEDGKMPEDAYFIPPPDCSQVPNYDSPLVLSNPSGKIDPGNYAGGLDIKGNSTLVAGGLYCVDGDFDIGNHDMTIDESNGKKGVTIYITNGSFTTGGNGTVVLKAPPDYPDPSPAIPGVLVYLAPLPSEAAIPDHGIYLGGNSTSEYYGALIAPTGDIKLNGTPGASSTGYDAVFHTQLVGYNVEVDGNAKIDITYQGEDNYSRPTSLELYK